LFLFVFLSVVGRQSFADMLAEMRVVVADTGGKTLSDSPGTD
jgi:hypothetical protein